MTAIPFAFPVSRFWKDESSRPKAVSPASDKVQTFLTDACERVYDSIAIGGRLREEVGNLADVCSECSSPNWDGYGAQPISKMAAGEAMVFLQLIPFEAEIPETVPEPSGNIGFEWSDNKSKLFSVSLNGKSRLSFAGLLGGGKKIHGSVRFIESIPEEIRELIVRHFPKGR